MMRTHTSNASGGTGGSDSMMMGGMAQRRHTSNSNSQNYPFSPAMGARTPADDAWYARVKQQQRKRLLRQQVTAARPYSRRRSIASFASTWLLPRWVAPGWYRLPGAPQFLVMLLLTGGFFLVELVVGFVVGSLTLQADAFHMASDVLALVIGFGATLAAHRPATARHSFGLARVEVVAGLANGVFLMATCFNIAMEALHRFLDVGDVKEHLGEPGHARQLLAVAVLGLAINAVGLFLFGGHAHMHGSHGHGACGAPRAGGASAQAAAAAPAAAGCAHDHDMNMRAVFLHVLGDALGSVGVIVSALVVMYGEARFGDARFYVDPLCSLLVVAILVAGSVPLIRRCAGILLQATPGRVDPDALRAALAAVPGVGGVRRLHVWALDGRVLVGSAHLLVGSGNGDGAVLAAATRAMHAAGVHQVTLQLQRRWSEADDEARRPLAVQAAAQAHEDNCGCCPPAAPLGLDLAAFTAMCDPGGDDAADKRMRLVV